MASCRFLRCARVGGDADHGCRWVGPGATAAAEVVSRHGVPGRGSLVHSGHCSLGDGRGPIEPDRWLAGCVERACRLVEVDADPANLCARRCAPAAPSATGWCAGVRRSVQWRGPPRRRSRSGSTPRRERLVRCGRTRRRCSAAEACVVAGVAGALGPVRARGVVGTGGVGVGHAGSWLWSRIWTARRVTVLRVTGTPSGASSARA